MYLKNNKEIAESTYEYQLDQEERLKDNESKTDEFVSSNTEESLVIADEIDDKAIFFVWRTSRCG